MPTGNKEHDKNLPGMGGVYNPFNLNLYAYSHQNPVKLLDPDGEAVGAAVRAFKLIKKAYKVYKKEGKLTWKNLKKAGLDELIDFAGDLYTLFDENASLLDKAEALSDLALGTEFSNKGAKEVKRIVDKVIKGGKQARKKLGRYYPDAKVGEIMKGKQGRIRKVNLDKGSPSWDDIQDLTWGEIVKGAKARKPGYKIFKKLLLDRRFDK